MTTHDFQVSVGDQVFVGDRLEEVGAVQLIAKDHVMIYIENAGQFRIEGAMVLSAHDAKLVLDPAKLEPALVKAIATAHARETE
ncbi:MAG: hypothetical protein ABI867_19765 [Kofleriaceae bacterium]